MKNTQYIDTRIMQHTVLELPMMAPSKIHTLLYTKNEEKERRSPKSWPLESWHHHINTSPNLASLQPIVMRNKLLLKLKVSNIKLRS